MTIQQMLLGGGGTSTINLVISASRTTNYNIRTAAGSPSSRVDVILTINSGIYAGGNPGITTGTGWATGSTIKIINNGYITGAGGNGGRGGNVGSNGSAGQIGKDALSLGWNVTIDNTNGYIFGGGGGGGGGAGIIDGLGGAAGGGGGGGQGYPGGAGGDRGSGGGIAAGDGTDGSRTNRGSGGAGGQDGFYPVTGGNGGNGGLWASNGVSGQSVTGDTTYNGGFRGAGGKAIDLNGYTVTWLGGNNSTQVKGAVS